jgi:hypothetical protein
LGTQNAFILYFSFISYFSYFILYSAQGLKYGIPKFGFGCFSFGCFIVLFTVVVDSPGVIVICNSESYGNSFGCDGVMGV